MSASQTAATRLEEKESKCESKSEKVKVMEKIVTYEKWCEDQGSEIKRACKSESDSEHEGTRQIIERKVQMKNESEKIRKESS